MAEKLGAMAPHWLDAVIDGKKTEDGVAKAICDSADFKAILQQAVANGKRAEETKREHPDYVDCDFTQTVRATIVQGINQSKVDVNDLSN
jgi:hypothetical protein